MTGECGFHPVEQAASVCLEVTRTGSYFVETLAARPYPAARGVNATTSRDPGSRQ